MAGSEAASTAAILAVALIICVVFVVIAVRGAQQRRLVRSSSVALQQLNELNLKAESHLSQQEPINSSVTARVESKGKFDRFDLSRFLSDSVLEYEPWYSSQIASRLTALQLFNGYQSSVERLASDLGASEHPKVRRDRFVRIESRLFEHQQLSQPVASAVVAAEVKYTSPQGRNSYSRRLVWDFDQLRRGLESAQAVRAQASTTAALRARERSLMTSNLRVDVLRRDGYRCQMCGASRNDGVQLHVDHIVPVSRGGRTLPENLQTLCQDCNLGKGNRFEG